MKFPLLALCWGLTDPGQLCTTAPHPVRARPHSQGHDHPAAWGGLGLSGFTLKMEMTVPTSPGFGG